MATVNNSAAVLDTAPRVQPAISVSLDRRKNDFDVMERVLGQVRDDEHAPHTDVVSLEVRPGVITSTESAVQVTVGRDDEDERRRDRGDD